MKCDVCNSSYVAYIGEKDGWKFRKCALCGYTWVFPRPSPEDFKAAYDSGFFYENYSAGKEIYEKREIQYELDVDYLKNFFVEGSVMDYGCGNGQFISHFPDRWNAYGHDPYSGKNIVNPKDK